MRKHTKHGEHPHDKMAAMPQFNEGHWEKNIDDIEVADERYSSEFNQEEEYRKDVDDLAKYARKHKMQY